MANSSKRGPKQHGENNTGSWLALLIPRETATVLIDLSLCITEFGRGTKEKNSILINKKKKRIKKLRQYI